MNAKETHAKQTEFIRVRDTGEVCKVKNISEHFIGVWEWVSMAEKQTKVYERDEVDFCTPIGFKDGTAAVVDDPTEYDGKMICIGDGVATKHSDHDWKVVGFHYSFGLKTWYLRLFSDSRKYPTETVTRGNKITDHTPAHTKTRKVPDSATIESFSDSYNHDHLATDDTGSVEEPSTMTATEAVREQEKIEKLPRNPYKSDYQKTVNELIDAENELQANRDNE